jgi:hypothetical protein
MSATPRDPMASAIAPDKGGRGLPTDVFCWSCLEWDPDTFENLVGPFTNAPELAARNLPVVNPAAMRTGRVLVARAGSGMALVILGPLDSPQA